MRSGWEQTTLGAVVSFKGGGTPSTEKSSYWGGDIPWVSPKDMKSSEVGDSIDKITPEAIENSAASLIPENAVLIVVRSGILARTIPVAITARPLAVNQDIKALCPSNEIDPCYLHYFMQASEPNILKLVTRGATVHRLSTDSLKALKFPKPPLAEQQRIVSILNEAFAELTTATANIEKNIRNARELFDSYVHAVFEKGNNWRQIRLGDVTEKITKGSSPKWQGINYVDAPGVLFVTSENVGANRLIMNDRKYVEERFNEKDKKSILKKGDVLTNIVGASIGRTAIYELDDPANINQAVCLIRCNEKVLNNKYLCYTLNSHSLRQFLHNNEKNNARANLSLGFFTDLEIPLPEMPTQIDLVHQFEEMANFVANLHDAYGKKSRATLELRQSILQRAFSGELTPPPSQAIREAAE